MAEQGLTANGYLAEASAFYGTELAPWLREMGEVLAALGVDPGAPEGGVRSAGGGGSGGGGGREAGKGGGGGDAAVLAHVGRFAQSLGSSGNHFMELASDDAGKYWIVVHSGSRALGAMVHGVIAEVRPN